jgi:hypothetical protein
VHLVRDAAAVHDPTAFTDPENWNGGFHELSWEVGDRDDERLQRVVTALWWAARDHRLLRQHRQGAGRTDRDPRHLGFSA